MVWPTPRPATPHKALSILGVMCLLRVKDKMPCNDNYVVLCDVISIASVFETTITW